MENVSLLALSCEPCGGIVVCRGTGGWVIGSAERYSSSQTTHIAKFFICLSHSSRHPQLSLLTAFQDNPSMFVIVCASLRYLYMITELFKTV